LARFQRMSLGRGRLAGEPASRKCVEGRRASEGHGRRLDPTKWVLKNPTTWKVGYPRRRQQTLCLVGRTSASSGVFAGAGCKDRATKLIEALLRTLDARAVPRGQRVEPLRASSVLCCREHLGVEWDSAEPYRTMPCHAIPSQRQRRAARLVSSRLLLSTRLTHACRGSAPLNISAVTSRTARCCPDLMTDPAHC